MFVIKLIGEIYCYVCMAIFTLLFALLVITFSYMLIEWIIKSLIRGTFREFKCGDMVIDKKTGDIGTIKGVKRKFKTHISTEGYEATSSIIQDDENSFYMVANSNGYVKEYNYSHNLLKLCNNIQK